jgi:hypothetical protein
MNTICLSIDTNKIMKNALTSRGYTLIETVRTDAVYSAIASHCDIYLCKVGNSLVVAQEQLSNIESGLKACGIDYASGSSPLGSKYPRNIRYNAAQIGQLLVHNTKYTDPVLLQTSLDAGLEPVFVKQGYTKCNLVVVDDQSAITSDPGIAEKLKEKKIDVLEIVPGHVKLQGFSYGFLGGTTGRAGDEIYFNGDLSAHPDCERIAEFIRSRGLRAVWFAEYPLEDVGSFIQI